MLWLMNAPADRRTPFFVKIAYGQLLLAAIGLACAPVYALRTTYSQASPSPKAVASAITPPAASAETLVSAPAAENDVIAHGETIFNQTCFACHQSTGQGIPGVFPPLAGSDFLLADPLRAVGVVLNGLAGPVTVNGVRYEGAMPPMPLSDKDAAAVISYVLQAWGNAGPTVTTAEVARVRAAVAAVP
jgi:nitrite reductase (NO-forming)